MKISVNDKQYKAWNIAIIAGLVFAFFFLRGYVGIIILAAISAFIFNPIHQRFLRRYKRPGTAASLTFLVSLVAILLPLSLIVFVTFLNVKNIISGISTGDLVNQINTSSQSFIDSLNRFLAELPGAPHVTQAEFTSAVNTTLTKLAEGLISLITSTIGSFTGVITSAIIYIYLFVNILMYQDKIIDIVSKLNPLGRQMSGVYLSKMGSMTTAMAKGQFTIAFLQGLESSVILYLVGFHGLFSFFLILLSFLSLIPLGAGIVTIPLGILMILGGNIWQGVVVIANHLLVVTNIDNVVRPRLVPDDAKLNSALTILSVFAGVAMFGFLGIIIGPVVMIVLITTLTTFLEIESSRGTKLGRFKRSK